MTYMAASGKPEHAVVRGTGVVLRDPFPWTDTLQLVETAEEMGYRAVFVPEISAREAFGTLAGVAPVTSTILLGTGVVTMSSRSPVTTAMAAATLQELSGGRHVLGLGTGTSHAGPGRGPVAPLRRLRAYVDVVCQVLSGRPVEDHEFDAAGFALGLEVDPPPIWLAALGDRAVALAGRIADGVLLNWCTPERVARARRGLRESAERSGRNPDSITVGAYVRACLGVDEAIAGRVLQEATAQYAALPPYRAQFEAMGFGAEADVAAAAALAGGKPETVPLGLVRALTVMGSGAEAMARFDAYREAGADLVLCYPVPALEALSSVMGTLMAAAPSPSVEH